MIAFEVDTPQRDIDYKQQDRDADQPFPPVAGLERQPAVVKEWIFERANRVGERRGRFEELAAAGFGQAAQQRQVRLGGIELGRIVDRSGDGLEPGDFPVAHFGQAHHVGADFLGGKLRLVTAGAGLFEPHGGPLAFGADDGGLEVEEIPVVALVIHGFDQDVPFAFVDGDLGGEVRVLDAAKSPLGDLGPELAVLAPAQPVLGPARFGVARPGDGPAQSILPVGQERVALVGDERSFGTALGCGANVALKLRISADAADDFRDRGNLRRKRFLEDGGFEDHCGLFDEDLGELRRVLDIVKPAAAELGHHHHRVRSGVAADEHGADGDARADDVLHELLRGRGRVAVGEDDDVLEVRVGFLEGFVGFGHDALEAAQISLAHAGDLPAEVGFVRADLGEREQPPFGAVPKDDAQFVRRPEGVEHAQGAVAGDLVAIGKLHAVHDEHHGAAGQDLLGVQLHVDRQGGFEGRAAVAAGRVGLVAADTDEADAEIADGAFEQAHVVLANVAGGQIADEDGVVALCLGERGGEGVEAGQLHVQFGRAQGVCEVLILRRLEADNENARIAADIDEAGGFVVLRDLVADGFDGDGVCVKLGLIQLLVKGE